MDGIPLRRLVPPQGAAVLLVYDPSDVFACGASISEWVSWGRRNPGRLVLAFTRRPTAAEAKLLLTSRVRGDLVLARPRFGSSTLRSTEFLVLDGHVRREEVVSKRVLRSPLLRLALRDPSLGFRVPPTTLPFRSGPPPVLPIRPSLAAKEER